MEIYFEDIIFDNLIIDFLILFITAKLLKKSYKIRVLFLSSLIGVIFTIINLFINLNNYYLFFYKIIIAILMVLISFGTKKYLLSFLVFLFVTFIMGGACFFVCFSFGELCLNNGIISYKLFLPMWLIITIVSLVSFELLKIVKAIKDKAKFSNFIYDIQIFHNNTTKKSQGFLDTGNTLSDPENTSPIILLEYKTFSKFFNIPLHEILLKRLPLNLSNPHYIKVNTVTASSQLLIFTIDKIKIKQNNFSKIITNVKVGLTLAVLENKLGVPILLNPKLINGDSYE